MIGKSLRKTIQQLLSIFYVLKNNKYVRLVFQKLVPTAKTKYLS